MSKIKITLRKSPIHYPARKRKTLQALGLNRLHKTVEKEYTPQIKGMIRQVDHMVDTEEVK